MTLSTLIKKGGLIGSMTMTPATVATQEANHSVTVALVAGVTVAERTELLSELPPDEVTSIKAWLVHIDETDRATIAEVLEQCRVDPDARRYFLKRSEEVPEKNARL